MLQKPHSHAIEVPLLAALRAVGFGQHENVHHFEVGTLFWSLTRLFGCYERVFASLELPFGQRPYLEADVENFIIRSRIVFNDVAYGFCRDNSQLT